jgi:predicted MFS family arabinose efflux permease
VGPGPAAHRPPVGPAGPQAPDHRRHAAPVAAIGDVAHPSWRATAVGVYRLWRDSGFAVGALLAGLVADLAGLQAAVWAVAALTAASGLVVAGRMYETHPPAGRP